MSKKINILVIPADMFGVGYFRSINPHVNLEKLYPDLFHVEINPKPDLNDTEYLKQFDILHYHKTLCNIANLDSFINRIKSLGIIPVIDIDDYWMPSIDHPSHNLVVQQQFDKKIISGLKSASYVTTTTNIFANEIKKINKNVVVIPNAIDTNEPQFQPKPEPNQYNKIRFGILCGSSHFKDIEILLSMTNKLKSDGLLDKCQFVLCGFDLRGSRQYKDPMTGEIKERPLLPQESIWYEYEKILTNNYEYLTPEHKRFLLNFDSHFEMNANDCYRRIWTKPVQEYATGYNAFDVLLVPLRENLFNKCKSQLKVIEAGFMNKAIIAQDYGPYTIDLKNIYDKGGVINEDGNAITIKTTSNHKDWYNSIKRLINNPELIPLLQKRLYDSVKDKYSIEKVSETRKDFYYNIVNKIS